MLLIDLFEARQESAMQILSRYVLRPNMFVTFTNIEKLGINPRTEHTSTPIGIYAYPLPEAYAMMENKLVSFAGDRKYICLFEGMGDLLDLQSYDTSDYERDMDGLAEQWYLLSDNEDFAMNLLVTWEGEMSDRYPLPGMALWKLIERISNRAERLYHRDAMVISNSMYRALGYSGIIDHGGSIIHVHEPTQALFFAKNACRTVEFIINDHIEGYRPAFPDRGVKKIKGWKPARDAEDYPVTQE